MQREFYILAAKSFSCPERETGAGRRTRRELLCALGLGSRGELYSDKLPFEICRHKIRPQMKYLEIQKMHPFSSRSSTRAFRKEGRSCFVFFLGKAGNGWDECQKLPFGMSQEIGMGRFALIPA